jgi:hypothetical protein
MNTTSQQTIFGALHPNLLPGGEGIAARRVVDFVPKSAPRLALCEDATVPATDVRKHVPPKGASSILRDASSLSLREMVGVRGLDRAIAKLSLKSLTNERTAF